MMGDERTRRQPPHRESLYALLFLSLAILLATPGAIRADDTFGGDFPGDTIRVAGSPLEAASLHFARALAEPSGDGLAAALATGGIRLQLDETGHAGLTSRQAVASLRDFLRGYEGSAAIVARASAVAGSPNRGFAEVHWSGRRTGTSQAMRRTLFLGLLRESGEWRVDEVRLVR